MASVNKAIIVGHLGRDPEVRYSADGAAIANVSIATSFSRKNRDTGERIEEVEWHRIVFFGRLAEIAGEYLRKGSAVYIEGRLNTQKWQDKETGQDRYSTRIIADQLQMLGGRDDGAAQNDRREPQQRQPQAPQRNRYAEASGGRAAAITQAPLDDSGLADNIPF